MTRIMKAIVCAAVMASYSVTAVTAQTMPHQAAADHERGEGEGEVRRIDKAQSKITLRHGDIKGMDMPAMSMVFQVKSPELLDTVKVGDKVRFVMTRGDGALWILSMEKL